jgi:NhaP-type Na+/H+ or K+/H+ antiporter
MTPSILIAMVVIIGWSLLAGRLERWRIPGPLLMVVAGIAIGFSTRNDIGNTLNTVIAERAVELILALLLFVDATEVKGGYFGGEREITARLLCIALPLSLILATVLGVLLLPDLSVAVVLIVAATTTASSHRSSSSLSPLPATTSMPPPPSRRSSRRFLQPHSQYWRAAPSA